MKDIKQEIVEIRDKNRYTFKKIQEIVNKEYNTNYSVQYINKVYNQQKERNLLKKDENSVYQIIERDVVYMYAMGYFANFIVEKVSSKYMNINYGKIREILIKNSETISEVSDYIKDTVFNNLVKCNNYSESIEQYEYQGFKITERIKNEWKDEMIKRLTLYKAKQSLVEISLAFGTGNELKLAIETLKNNKISYDDIKNSLQLI